MCGIIGVIRKQTPPKNDTTAAELVHSIFEDQKDRGMQGFGVITINEQNKVRVMRSTELMSTLLNLRFDCRGMKAVLLHHRMPTSTPNKMGQTHPIFVSHPTLLDHDYLVIHNGVIGNDRERKEVHERMGFKYTTDMAAPYSTSTRPIINNDSEAVAIDYALAIEGKAEKIESTGSAALIAVQLVKGTNQAKTICYWRAINPIKVHEDQFGITMSSEGPGTLTSMERLNTLDLATFATSTVELLQKASDFKFRSGVPAKEIGFNTKSEPKSAVEKAIEEVDKDDVMEYPTDWDEAYERPEVKEVLERLDYRDESQECEDSITEAFEKLSDPDELEAMNRKEVLGDLLKEIARIFNNSYEHAIATLEDAKNMLNEELEEEEEENKPRGANDDMYRQLCNRCTSYGPCDKHATSSYRNVTQ